MKPALIIGSTCVDIIINIDHIPATEENIRPTSQSMALGGCAYNVAYMMRLLDASHTFICPVGGGTYGEFVAKELMSMGVPIAIRVPEKENGCCYCLVEAGGERTFMSYHGVEYTFQKHWMESYRPDDYSYVYVCGLEIEEPTGINLIEYLEQNPQLEVCYAPGPRGVLIEKEKRQRMLDLHPVLHVNEHEACELGSAADYVEAAATLQNMTQNTVIVTLGKNGTYCLEKGGMSYTVPGVHTETIVDTIGAGDSHIGTILACLVKDLPLKDAIAYANQVAAAVVTVQGASLPPDMLPVQEPYFIPENRSTIRPE